ncbi:hypothetical protein [Chamaesiphon sp. OTE_20_metabat_361]|uniref:hypothetical protein n=1 Tax=Chamaesiphon sp. OTE_20_metabat_361 TaxID=2964689 RepID=UPI00286BC7C1|nr:hypothetical protein [Chamaesiphon sp. OTE_20_metabat_361]
MNPEIDVNSPPQLPSNELPSAVPAVPKQLGFVDEIHEIAERDRHDPLALLRLLRTLEQLHREIQQGYFQSALPNSRQALYALLRDIEENGGWPYIQRWKLQELFANLSEQEK